MANRKLGKYEIIERLGRGGMAEVYRGYHVSLDRYVAIKVLHAFLADDPEFKNRFEREAQNVAKLRHGNIVQVYDFEYDEATESYYMVMELIDGPTLKERLSYMSERGEQMPLNEAIRIIREAAAALAYAHSRSMIHRDVKPANLMLDHDNRVVLTDFGIAKIVTGAQFTASGGMVGTPAYMAPEQGLGEAGDERSDLYSLGIILFQLATGQLPYDAETPLAIILKHLNAPIPSAREINPDVPEVIDHIITKAIAKEPGDRYQTASEMIEDLQRFERGEIPEKASANGSPSLLQMGNTDTVEVPRVAEETPGPALTAPVAGERRRRFPWWGWGGLAAGILASVFLLGTATGIISIGGGSAVTPTGETGTAAALAVTEAVLAPTDTATITPSPESSATPTASPSSTPTYTPRPTDTPSVTPTPTRTPTATQTPTPTVTSSPTPATPIAAPIRNILMRIGPGLQYPQRASVNLSDTLNIVGISQDGLWFYVVHPNGLPGWVAAAQINVYGNLRGIPVILPPTNTPTYTPTFTLTPTPTRTPTNTTTPTITPTPSVTPTPTQNATQTVAARTQAAVQATLETARCIFDYEIVEQDPAEDKFIPADTDYERRITLFNSGTCAWATNTYLRFLEGESFDAGPSIFIPQEVGVGATYNLIFSGRTPERGNDYTSKWQLRTPGGIPIGEPITITVRVFEQGG